jgi:hypothetical protein
MSFSEAFARGYAIGDAARKRRAASKYFEKVKELTSDDEAVEDVTEIGGLDVPNSALSVGEGGVGEPAIPAPAEVRAETAIDTGTAEPAAAEVPEEAPDVEALAPAESAIPIEDTPVPVNEEALSPIQVSAPKTIKLKSDAEAKKIKERRKSLTQGNIKELDRLAMDAAMASGDIEVYTALQKTTNSLLQAKVLKYMGQAQTAATAGDTPGLKAALGNAYRFIPDGHEPNFKERDGKLFTVDPWEDDKEIELDSEMVGNLTTMIRDPEKWAEIVRQGKRDRAADARDARRTKAAEDAVTETRRANGVKEITSKLDLDRKVARDKYLNLESVANAARDLAKAKAAGGSTGMKPDDARQYGESVSQSIDAFLSPTKQPADPSDLTSRPTRGKPPEGYEIFVTAEGGMSPLGQEAKDLGGQLGIANPHLGPDAAGRAGLELTRALVDPNGPKIDVDPPRGTIAIMVGGRMTEWNLPDQMMEALIKAGDVVVNTKADK